MQRAFVTGAAGFIGSSLCDRLLQEDWEVVGWDNFSTGQPEFVESAKQHARFRLITGDNFDLKHITEAMSGSSAVFHLAANADVRFGLEHPRRDLEQNTIATFNILEAMRSNQIKKIATSFGLFRFLESGTRTDMSSISIASSSATRRVSTCSGMGTSGNRTFTCRIVLTRFCMSWPKTQRDPQSTGARFIILEPKSTVR